MPTISKYDIVKTFSRHFCHKTVCFQATFFFSLSLSLFTCKSVILLFVRLRNTQIHLSSIKQITQQLLYMYFEFHHTCVKLFLFYLSFLTTLYNILFYFSHFNNGVAALKHLRHEPTHCFKTKN